MPAVSKLKNPLVPAENGLWCRYCNSLVQLRRSQFYAVGHGKPDCPASLGPAPPSPPEQPPEPPENDGDSDINSELNSDDDGDDNSPRGSPPPFEFEQNDDYNNDNHGPPFPPDDNENHGPPFPPHNNDNGNPPNFFPLDNDYNSFVDRLRATFGDAGNGGDDDFGGRRGSVAWYQSRALQPIYEGSECSVIQAAYLLLKLKQEKAFPDRGFDMLLRVLKEVFLPTDNLFPPSLHIVNGLAGVDAIDDFTYHVCPCGKHVYPRCLRDDWPQHYHDKCPKCEADRFVTKKIGERVTWEPNKWCIYFGVGHSVRTRLFSNPNFTQERTKGRDKNWYNSPDANELNQRLGGLLFSEHASAYAIGYDFAGLFNFKDHSTGLVFMRCEDMPSKERTQRQFQIPLMIIPGPQQPEDLDCYFSMILNEFEEYGPQGRGLVVTPVVRDALGNLQNQPSFVHKLILTGLYADTPARCKAGQFMKSAAAYLGCHFCWLTGIKDKAAAGNNATLFLGYKEPVQISRGLLQGQAMRVGINDDQLVLTEEQQRWRALHVEQIKAQEGFDAGQYGCSGYSIFHLRLPYLHYNNFFILPFAHSVFLGIVKDLTKLLLGMLGRKGPAKDCVISYKGLRLIKQHEGDFTLTPDFGRPVSSIINKSGRYVIENWVRWVDVFSTYLLSKEANGEEVLATEMKKAWGHLRRFIWHHMRPSEDSNTYERRQAARTEFLEFCKIMETKFPANCKLNMHLIACRLSYQENARGSVYEETELWVERCVQLCKTKTRYKSTTQPELVAAKYLVITSALETMTARYPSVKTFDDWVPQYRAIALHGDAVDEDTQSSYKMVSKGRLSSVLEWEQMEPAVKLCLQNNDEEGLFTEDILQYYGQDQEANLVEVWVHTMADLDNEEIVSSVEHTRSRTREGHHVLVEFQEGRRQEQWVARVRKLVRLLRRQPPCKTFRLAIVDVFKKYPDYNWHDADLGTMYKAREYITPDGVENPARSFLHIGMAVPLHSIVTKVVRATKAELVRPLNHGPTYKQHYFLKYSFSSGL